MEIEIPALKSRFICFRCVCVCVCCFFCGLLLFICLFLFALLFALPSNSSCCCYCYSYLNCCNFVFALPFPKSVKRPNIPIPIPRSIQLTVAFIQVTLYYCEHHPKAKFNYNRKASINILQVSQSSKGYSKK